jgi:hypothetical protein
MKRIFNYLLLIPIWVIIVLMLIPTAIQGLFVGLSWINQIMIRGLEKCIVFFEWLTIKINN